MNLNALMKSAEFAHSRQVSKISVLLAEGAGYASEETAVIEQAALYHDIGKTDIPEHILKKPGALTSAEFEIVKTHTSLGYNRINEAIRVLTAAAAVCREHHERPDGNGYSRMDAGDIHPYAKLIAVADVFDALFSERAYKKAWEPAEIRTYFHNQAGKQFDAKAVTLLFSRFDEILTLYGEPKCV